MARDDIFWYIFLGRHRPVPVDWHSGTPVYHDNPGKMALRFPVPLHGTVSDGIPAVCTVSTDPGIRFLPVVDIRITA